MARAACDGKPDNSRLHNFVKHGSLVKINRDQATQSYRCNNSGCGRIRTEVVAIR